MAQYSDAELAAELSKMLNGSYMVYPNPIETEIKKRGKLFLEGKNDLFILNSSVGETSTKFETEVLKKLANAGTIKNVYLYPVPGWSESDPLFDFSGFSKLFEQYLEKAEHLLIQHMRIKNLELRGIPQLRCLHLVDPQCQDEKWKIELPELRDLIMENHTPPEKEFGQALIKSPKIESFFAHKYYHERSLPKLYLPNCKRFTFRRGEFTSRLSLYIPRVEALNLDANYSLSNITLLKRGHKKHKQWNVPTGVTHSKFTLSYTNAILGAAALRTLHESGRILDGGRTSFKRKRTEI